MKLQTDKKISPYINANPPTYTDGDREGNTVNLFAWAKDHTRIFSDFSRQVFDQYNLHITNPYTHTALWKILRANRATFRNASDGGTTITFPATVNKPLFIVTGEPRQATVPEGYVGLKVTTDLTCNLATNGIGGLDTGSVASDSDYYFYGVNNNDDVGIIASLRDPSLGPTSYTYGQWMYLGSCSTKSGSAVFPAFISSRGRLIYAKALETKTHTGTTSLTSLTFNGLPVTAKFAYVGLSITGTNIGQTVELQDGIGFGNLDVSGQATYTGPTWIPIFADHTIKIKLSHAGNTASITLLGFEEDPSEYS